MQIEVTQLHIDVGEYFVRKLADIENCNNVLVRSITEFANGANLVLDSSGFEAEQM